MHLLTVVIPGDYCVETILAAEAVSSLKTRFHKNKATEDKSDPEGKSEERDTSQSKS